MARENEITQTVIGAAIAVHRALGPGLLESAYEACLCYELSDQGLAFRSQIELPVVYRGIQVDCGYKIDLWIEERVIVELKTVAEILPVHEAQLLTYLKLTKCTVGLLINFNVPVLKDGIRRLVNHFVDAP